MVFALSNEQEFNHKPRKITMETYIPDVPIPGEDGGYYWPENTAAIILVEPGKVTLPDGKVITTDKYGGPLTRELAEAVRRAQGYRGVTIKCKGVLKGLQFGGGNYNKSYIACWGTPTKQRPITNLHITSQDPKNPATIQGMSVWGDYRQGSGVDQLLFKDLILSTEPYPAGGSSKSALLVAIDSFNGLIGIKNCKFVASKPTDWQGWGAMWWVRGHGRARWDIQGCEFPRVQEHCMYIDGTGADGLGHSFFMDNFNTGPAGRTFLQLCNRSAPSPKGGPRSGGNIYIFRNKAIVESHGGGSAITIAGHSGGVYIDDLEITGNSGGIVFWSDVGHGLYYNTNGFTCDLAHINNVRINMPNADRSHMAFSGVEHVILDSFEVIGNRTAVELWSSYGGPVDNGKVLFYVPAPVSAYPGFKAGVKVKYRGKTLTNGQIDAMKG